MRAEKRKDLLLPRRHPREDEEGGTENAHLDAFDDFCTGSFCPSRSRQIAGGFGPQSEIPDGLVPNYSRVTF